MKQIMKQLLIAVLTLITAPSFAQMQLVTIDGKYAVNPQGKLLKVVVDTFPTFTVTEFPTDRIIKFRLVGYNQNFALNVDWGDGTNNSYTGGKDYSPEHTYANTDPRKIRIGVENPEQVGQVFMNITGNSFTAKDVKNFTVFTDAGYISLSNMGLNKYTDEIGKLVISQNVRILDLGANELIPFQLPNLPTLLEELIISNTAVNDVFSFSQLLPVTLKKLQISARTQENLDNSLIYINSTTYNAGAKTLIINRHGQTITPSAAGLTAYNNLVATGWTITYE